MCQESTRDPFGSSQFDYTYDAVGEITTWTQNYQGAPNAQRYEPRYDSASQLVGAVLKNASTNAVLKEYGYGYDLAGNRIREQSDTTVTASGYNNLNQLIGQSPGGPMEFSGTLNEPGTLTLAGQPASVDTANNWRGQASVTVGANAIPLVATDVNGNATTKTINITVTGGPARSLTYDLDGAMVNDGAGKTYAFDAANRLVKITQASGVTDFVYNGLGQRVQEKLNGTLIKQWIWCDGVQPCEERDAANNVTRRFFGGLGEQIGGTSFYCVLDHLGSVREMTDSTGAVRARYDYDPYGRMTKLSGDLDADFGFTGFYRHTLSGLNLTLNRAYDSNLGCWLSRDPIEEQGGANLYTYVGNDSINWFDPLGLSKCSDLALEIVTQAGKLAAEWAKYDPVADAKGGFRIPGRYRTVGGRLYPQRTKPGGHYKEMMYLKRGLWNRLNDFKRDCWDDDNCPKPPKIPAWVWDLAKKPIPVPITPSNPFQEWAISVPEESIPTPFEAFLYGSGGALLYFTGIGELGTLGAAGGLGAAAAAGAH